MKLSKIAIFIGFALSVQAAWAGDGLAKKAATEDFTSLIEENSTAQKQLATDLSKQLNTQELPKKNPDFNKIGEEELGKSSSENVAVESSAPREQKAKTQNFEKKNFHRLADELKDAN